MKFTLLDANDEKIAVVDTLAFAEALAEFSEILKRKYKWDAVSGPHGFYDVVVKDERNRTAYFQLLPKKT